jgi:hypothetical protein
MEMQTPNNEVKMVPIVGRTADGKTVWYTGRAGDGWVSSNPKEAFLGFSLEGARSRATQFNRMTAVHGIYFVACAGDLALEVQQ